MKKIDYPKISIITPSYNQGKFIRKNITSVLKQGYPNVEHIIIDGGSNDETVSILKEYPHLIWVSEKDRGQSHAFNKGLKKASGEIIGWINSDDYLLDNALFFVSKEFQSNKNLDWLIGNILFDFRSAKLKSIDKTPETSFQKLLSGPSIVRQQGGFFKSSFLKNLGGLDENIHFAMDYDLWLKASRQSKPLIINRDLASFTIHEDQKTSFKYFRVQNAQILRIMKKYGSPLSKRMLFFFKYLTYMIKDYIKQELIKVGMIDKRYSTISYFKNKRNKSKKNILIYLDKTDIGGLESLILDEINFENFLPKSKLFLITSKEGGFEKKFAKIDKQRYLKLRRTFPIDLILCLRIRIFIKRNKIRIIHTHNPVSGIHAYIARLGLKAKLISSHHNFINIENRKDQIARRILLKKADANIFVSKCLLEDYEKRMKINNPLILENGVNYEKLSQAQPIDLKKQLGINPKTKLIGFVGNITKNIKDPLTLCRALQIIHQQSKNFRIVIVGKYSESSIRYKEAIDFCKKNNLNKYIYFIGPVENVGLYLSSFDILVNSSYSEASPMIILEACGMGLPVIANDIPAHIEIGQKIKSLIIFESRNSLDLAKKILEVLNNEPDKIGQKNMKYSHQNYSMQKHINDLQRIYKSFL